MTDPSNTTATPSALPTGDNDALVTFAIPLIPLGSPAQKAYRDRMLSATLRSIYGQTDGSFRVMIIGDRRPRIDFPTDHRLEFVLFRPKKARNTITADGDKGWKLSVAARLFGARGGGYFMPVDMDDFISRRLVAFVRETRDPNGYIIERGYVLDARRTTATAIPDARYHAAAYHKTCGTCTIFNMAPADVQPGGRFFRLNREGHFSNAEEAIAEGRPFRVFPFAAGVYTFNHGINVTAARSIAEGRAAERRQWLESLAQYSVPARELTEEFGVPARYPLPEDESAPPEHPTLTVAISTHRRPAGLRRLLSALRLQVEGFPERDIVVVNDGSHDEAYQKVVLEFQDLIQYRALPKNMGVAAARNAAAEVANGDYLVFTDDDCQPPSWWLDWLTARLKRAPELDVVAGSTVPLWRPGKPSFVARLQAHHRFIPGASRSDGAIIFATANVAIRRSVFQSLNGFGFPGTFHGASEDTELANRLSLAGTAMVIDPEWTVRHDVGERFGALCRRYWRYGYASGAMTLLTSSPASHDSLATKTRRGNLRGWRGPYGESRKLSASFSNRRVDRFLSTVLGTLVRLAYLDGAAVAVRDANRGRRSGASA